MIEIVIFDMAGTTVDEQNLVYKTLHKATNESGYVVTLDEVLSIAAGKEKLQAIIDILGKLTDEETVKKEAGNVYNLFRKSLTEAYKTEPVKPQPGATIVFKRLKEKGIKVVLNTGYDRGIADLLLERLGWEDSNLIDLVITASEVENGRPHPDMILYAMDKLQCASAKKVLKIGDSTVDIEEGQRAGCLYNVGITTGAHSRDQLQSVNPTAVIDGLLELLPLIDN